MATVAHTVVGSSCKVTELPTAEPLSVSPAASVPGRIVIPTPGSRSKLLASPTINVIRHPTRAAVGAGRLTAVSALFTKDLPQSAPVSVAVVAGRVAGKKIPPAPWVADKPSLSLFT